MRIDGDIGLNNGQGYIYMQPERSLFPTYLGTKTRTNEDFNFEDILNAIIGGYETNILVTGETKIANQDENEGWITRVAGKGIASQAMRKAPRKSLLYLSLTDDEYSMLNDAVNKVYGAWTNIPSWIVLPYTGADEFGVGGLTSHWFLEDMITRMGFSPQIGIPSHWVRQLTCRDSESFGSAIQNLIEPYDPIVYIQGNYFFIQSKANVNSYGGSVGFQSARDITSKKVYRPKPEKYYIIGSAQGQFDPQRYRGTVYTGSQSDTIPVYDPEANDGQGGMVDWTQRWEGKPGIGNSYESVIRSWYSDETVEVVNEQGEPSGTFVERYEFTREDRFALDLFGTPWFSYYTHFIQKEWDVLLESYADVVFDQIDLRSYENTSWDYKRARLTGSIRNISGFIWVPDYTKPNHKKKEFKDYLESPNIPMEVEKTVYRYVNKDQAKFLSSYYNIKQPEDSLDSDSFRRWTWLYTPKCGMLEKEPPRYETDIRKMQPDNMIDQDPVFMQAESSIKIYTQDHPKQFSILVNRFYYNEFGLKKLIKNDITQHPGKVPREKSYHRAMQLESVSGEEGSDTMDSPADKHILRYLNAMEDVDTLRAWREMLGQLTGDLWYQVELSGDYFIEKGWPVNLYDIESVDGEKIVKPSLAGQAWIEGFQTGHDGKPGSAESIVLVEGSLV